MPQIGHEPGPLRTISGCIGHVYSVPAGAGGSGSVVFGFRKESGSALKRSAHPRPQKKYLLAVVFDGRRGARRIDRHPAHRVHGQ